MQLPQRKHIQRALGAQSYSQRTETKREKQSNGIVDSDEGRVQWHKVISIIIQPTVAFASAIDRWARFVMDRTCNCAIFRLIVQVATTMGFFPHSIFKRTIQLHYDYYYLIANKRNTETELQCTHTHTHKYLCMVEVGFTFLVF